MLFLLFILSQILCDSVYLWNPVSNAWIIKASSIYLHARLEDFAFVILMSLIRFSIDSTS